MEVRIGDSDVHVHVQLSTQGKGIKYTVHVHEERLGNIFREL